MKTAAMLFITFVSAGAFAQEAWVNVVHDHATGVVLPGETVRITARVLWTPDVLLPNQTSFYYTFAGLGGDLRSSGDLGDATNPASLYYPPLLQLGQPVGGSIMGFDVAVIPPAFNNTPPPAQYAWDGMDALWYEWTAPSVAQPTQIDFTFTPRALAPNVRLYVLGGPEFVEAQTTYNAGSILVVPTPASTAAIAGLWLVVAPRRRR